MSRFTKGLIGVLLASAVAISTPVAHDVLTYRSKQDPSRTYTASETQTPQKKSIETQISSPVVPNLYWSKDGKLIDDEFAGPYYDFKDIVLEEWIIPNL